MRRPSVPHAQERGRDPLAQNRRGGKSGRNGGVCRLHRRRRRKKQGRARGASAFVWRASAGNFRRRESVLRPSSPVGLRRATFAGANWLANRSGEAAKVGGPTWIRTRMRGL